jgi:predicted DNA-binding ribbon-helix-helix protein
MKQPDASCFEPMSRSIDLEIKRVTVTIPRRQLDELQSIAEREDVSVAWLVRKAVDKLLREGVTAPVANPARRVRGRS